MSTVYQRPILPYNYVSLQESNRYQILTQSLSAPPTAIMLDSDINFLIDTVNAISIQIDGIAAGILPGASTPTNAFKFATTDGNGNISFSSVTDAYCAVGSINANKLIDSSITALQIGNGAITNALIGANAVHAGNIANNTITAAQIADNTITAAQIANNTITAAQIVNNTITATQIANNTITAAQIADDTITAAQIADNTITAAQIANNTITAAQIVNNTITATQIANNTITATQIANNTITAAQTNFAAIKSDQIAGTSATLYTNPAVQQYHPSSVKFYAYFNGNTTGTNAPIAGYNVTSVQRLAAGQYQVNFTNPFTTSNYIAVPSCGSIGASVAGMIINSLNTNFCQINAFTITNSPVLGDPAIVMVSGYGTQ